MTTTSDAAARRLLGLDRSLVDFAALTEELYLAIRQTAPLQVGEVNEEHRFRADLGYEPASLRRLTDRVARLLSMPHLPSAPVRELRFVADLVDLVDVLLADGSARPSSPSVRRRPARPGATAGTSIPSLEDPPMATNDPLPELTLGADDAEQLRALAESLRDRFPGPGNPEFYDQAWQAAAELPYSLRYFLETFRRAESAGACLIHGFPVDDEAIGPTPSHWDAAGAAKATVEQELHLALCAMVLGEPFAWETLQSGRMIQNILPISGDEERQNGYGSQALLEFHTEDGFHPRRCDYLLLMGLRNHDRVPTIVASVRDVELSDGDREILSQPRFHIVPDSEHIRQLEARDPEHPALVDVYRMLNQPEPTPVLSGRPESPYLRIDRPFMYCAPGDAAAEGALDRLMAELERAQRDVVLAPGTLVIVDNHVAVHGRRSFTARYDGTDRWLKKITASRDLRRGLAPAGGSGRVIA
ncbi:guanitoxin biosynthesis L-enduracididine beta-hydroxylase GntD [Streptacidiphilus rugosus]|uniref:guanitoxin biosynthesis L-enduracididine beta-hydroxylase GntD n=1 Tax=Streptacidiphilus rugosus TaxID=405783 RepID=UPI000AC555B3|nr:guanitoxin biosynthesis L-enduracididine beta-hydroxylase GntD [Streptacidiphilus rugosus]